MQAAPLLRTATELIVICPVTADGLSSLLGRPRRVFQAARRLVHLIRDGLVLRHGGAASEEIPLASISSVCLGAPSRIVQHAAAADLIFEGEKERAHRAWADTMDPPRWRFLTICRSREPPVFLLAQSDAVALSWGVELAVRVSSIQEIYPLPTLGGMLWRRVRLRLDALAAHAPHGARTRLGAMSDILRGMAKEEESRLAWVRYHLSRGEQTKAIALGWSHGDVLFKRPQ